MSNMMETINCLDLLGQHREVKEEIFKKFEEVYEKTAFSGGPYVAEFEEKFASFTGAKYAIAVNSGTSALHLALLARGVKSGDEIILPANTFIATAWAISYCGATPVFVDCDKRTWQINVESIKDKITEKTKGIVGVHLYGMPFDIEEVKKVANANNLFLIEDAAQAHGATYNDVPVGTFGEMACFSFYPGKNLGACGEGGAITTNNKSYYQHLQKLRNHGSDVRYYHDELGFNMRMSGLSAASLTVKLKYLPKWNSRRQEIAGRYFNEIKNKKVVLQEIPEGSVSVYHLFVITTEDKDALVGHLKKHGINPGFHYPVPCHLQRAYAHLGYKKGELLNSEYLASSCLSLPMYSELTDDQVKHVIEVVNKY